MAIVKSANFFSPVFTFSPSISRAESAVDWFDFECWKEWVIRGCRKGKLCKNIYVLKKKNLEHDSPDSDFGLYTILVCEFPPISATDSAAIVNFIVKISVWVKEGFNASVLMKWGKFKYKGVSWMNTVLFLEANSKCLPKWTSQSHPCLLNFILWGLISVSSSIPKMKVNRKRGSVFYDFLSHTWFGFSPETTQFKSVHLLFIFCLYIYSIAVVEISKANGTDNSSSKVSLSFFFFSFISITK